MSILLPLLFLCWPDASAANQPGCRATGPPRLVVLIVIDQFPAYLLARLEKQLAPGGFRLLMDKGAWYQHAYYPQAATLTGVGHATIATGALPAGHGITGNEWYDRRQDRPVYCVEDRAHRWVGGHAQEGDGTSPRHLTSTTFGDEWRLARDFEPRVLAISLKDRSSILLGGQLGKSFWYDTQQGTFVSSTYYYADQRLPSWVEQFNASRPADKYWHQSWTPLIASPPRGSHAALRRYGIEIEALGPGFPHVLGQEKAKLGDEFYKLLLTVPQGNELMLDMARAAIDGEQLGHHDATDVLCLSLTANDYCGHNFGPESPEYLDITLQTDRQLESFFAALDRQVGLDQCVIVLTSDHGVAPTPEYLADSGLPVGRIGPDQIVRDADRALDVAFGPDDWCGRFLNPGLFLRSEPIRRHQVAPQQAERVAAEAIRRIPGVAATFTRSQLVAGAIPPTALGRAAAATFHPDRSPDVIIIQQPYWYLYKDLKNAGMHGSPYSYDTHVPVIFYGNGIVPGRYTRHVSPADIAPTICHLLGATAPAACEGEVLQEAVSGAAVQR